MTDQPDSYETLAGEAEAEERILRSRFIGLAAPAPDEAAARAFVDATRRRFHDARHVCHAWRVGPVTGPRDTRQDDGEPSGTAGEPILLAIGGAALHGVVVAVARYFGGVKLGPGGLARAYGGVAAAALAAAPRRTVLLGRRFRLRFEYAQQKTVQHLLASHGGHVETASYAAAITTVLWLPHSTWRAFTHALHDTSAGRLLPEPLDEDTPS
jgi:uncharacterized YigZ family protein